MTSSTSSAAPVFDWKLWPETEAFVDGLIERAHGQWIRRGSCRSNAIGDEAPLQGLGRSPGGRTAGRFLKPLQAWATAGVRTTMPWVFRSSGMMGDFPRIARSAERILRSRGRDQS